LLKTAPINLSSIDSCGRAEGEEGDVLIEEIKKSMSPTLERFLPLFHVVNNVFFSKRVRWAR
jgi:hypothetical protein